MPDVALVDEVVDSVVEDVVDLIVVEEVVEDTGLEEVDLVVQPDVGVAYSVPSVTTDTEVTAPSTEPFVHTDGGFPRELIDRSVITEYVDHGRKDERLGNKSWWWC